MLPHWSGLTAIMTLIAFVITTRTVTHQVHASACHYSPSLHHSCVLLFYDHAIMILTTLTTHILSYLSLTLPGLNLDPHSFNYSFLSRLCSFLFSPPHFLCNHSILTYDVLSLESRSAMATLVYIYCSRSMV